MRHLSEVSRSMRDVVCQQIAIAVIEFAPTTREGEQEDTGIRRGLTTEMNDWTCL